MDMSLAHNSLTAQLRAEQIRVMSPNVAMLDGKQWRSIPILIGERYNVRHDELASRDLASRDIHYVALAGSEDFGSRRIRELVRNYRLQALSEFEDLGFIISEQQGRFMVGPALRPRLDLEGRYYFGPADRRSRGYKTIHKSNFRVQLEVEKFEVLVNREDVSERELQSFFEEHPHFLSPHHVPLPHVRFATERGDILIPDFVLKPIVAQKRDSRWEILDLKLPQERLLTGRGARTHLSHQVMRAIAQLREYKDLFEKSDGTSIAAILGHALKRPKLGVLIGRLQNMDIAALENAQRHNADVRLVTYDEILDEQRSQLG